MLKPDPAKARRLTADGPVRNALPRLAELYAKTLRHDAGMKGAPSPRQLRSAAEIAVGAAFHEAGHVVALCHCLGELPEFVTIEKASEVLEGGPTWGFMRRRGNRLPVEIVRSALPGLQQQMKKETEAEVLVDLAGPAVDAMRAREDELIDASDRLEEANVDGGDTAHALEKLSVFQENEDLRWRWLHRLFVRTERLIRRPRVSSAISKVAEALLDRPTLDGDALFPLLADLPRRGWRL